VGHAETEIFPRDRVTIIGVLNVTPDSFSDGGRFTRGTGTLTEADAAVAEALAQERAGAHVIDIGGESTRPGANPVPLETELARTLPVIEALAKRTELPISIDTRKAPVARRALEAGARIVNDVSGGAADPDLHGVVAEYGATLILGHLRGTPATMQANPDFDDVLAEVADELERAAERAEEKGVPPHQIVVDPGIGFGKRLEDNLALLAQPGWLAERLGRRILVGPSRKSFLGKLTGDAASERDVATAAACAVAIFAGADAIRVHNVAMGVRAAQVASALRRHAMPGGDSGSCGRRAP